MCGHLLTRRRIMQHNSPHLPAFVCLSHELLSPYRLCNRNHVIAHNILKKQLSKLYNLYKFLYAKVFQDETNFCAVLL